MRPLAWSGGVSLTFSRSAFNLVLLLLDILPINAALNGETMTSTRTGRSQPAVDAASLLKLKAVGSVASRKHKSVAFEPLISTVLLTRHAPPSPMDDKDSLARLVPKACRLVAVHLLMMMVSPDICKACRLSWRGPAAYSLNIDEVLGGRRLRLHGYGSLLRLGAVAKATAVHRSGFVLGVGLRYNKTNGTFQAEVTACDTGVRTIRKAHILVHSRGNC
jgi:hypothetical protein